MDESLKFFFEADLNIANLESPITDSDQKKPHKPVYLKAKNQNNKLLDLFDVFSLANNHILDYDIKGLSDTIDLLKSNQKNYFRAGLNKKEACEPLRLTIKDQKIAFIGFSKWNAARGASGGTMPDNIHDLLKIIRKEKESGYFVVVYPHWNYEYVYYPPPDSRQAARKLIDAGADLIVGSHPHIIQGFERYRGKFIFYSLGNFVSHSDVFKNISMYENDPRINVSFVLSVKPEGRRPL